MARIVEATTGRVVARIVHDHEVTAVAWSPDGRLLATGSGEIFTKGETRIVEATSGKELALIATIGG